MPSREQLDRAVIELVETDRLQPSATAVAETLQILRKERNWTDLKLEAVAFAFQRLVETTSRLFDIQFVDIGGQRTPIFGPSAARSLVKDCVQFKTEHSTLSEQFGLVIGALENGSGNLVVRVGEQVVVTSHSDVCFCRPSPFIVLDIDGVHVYMRRALGTIALVVDSETARLYALTANRSTRLTSVSDVLPPSVAP